MPLKSRFQTRSIDPVKKFVTFTVVGRGEFPYDMLRYDQCWPESESQTHFMMASRSGSRHVTLTGLREPTDGRWLSFGWRIVE